MAQLRFILNVTLAVGFAQERSIMRTTKKELQHWEEIIEETQNNPKRASTFENAIRNASYIRRIVQICENGIERHKQEVIKKIQRGELK